MSVQYTEDLGSYGSPEVQRCPFPFLNRLLAEAPVYRDPRTGMYIVTRYDDIAYVNGHPELFSSSTPIMINRKTSVSEEVKRRYKERGYPEEFVLAFADPPAHTVHRALVDKVFTPKYVRELEPYVEALSSHLIDGFIEQDSANLLAGFAVHVPMYIISDQLGVDRADYEKFKIWSSAWVERNDPLVAPERELELTDHLIDMQNYLAERATRYLHTPADNLLSRLVHAELDGRRLTMPELLMIVQLLLVAGNETTTTGITTAMYLLLKNPALKARIMGDYGLIANFVEETLRAHAPVPHQYRVTTQDTRIGEFEIPKDAVVQVSYLAGNYDPNQWDRPDCFDIDRKGARNHLAFGRGIHFCLGNLLARAEMRITIRQLLERLEDLRFADGYAEPQFIPHFQIHTLDHLHVQFKPGKRLEEYESRI